MPFGSVDAVLMAAGMSRRFGSEDKLMALFDGVPLIGRSIRLVLDSAYFRNIFVIYRADEIKGQIEKYGVRAIYNDSPVRGMRESIRLGVQASDAGYYMFLPCDMPLLDAEIIGSLVEARKEGEITVPVFRGRQGNPVIFSSFFREELLSLGDGQSPRELKKKYSGAVKEVQVYSDAVLCDADSVEELEALELRYLAEKIKLRSSETKH